MFNNQMALVIYFLKRCLYKMNNPDNILNCSIVQMNNNKTPKIIKINSSTAVKLATKYLCDGKVIALPTDTVYGLACNANDPKAIQNLYNIKERDEQKPVSICAAEILNVKHWCEASHLPTGMLESLLPGAVTIVLNKSEYLDNPYLNPGVCKIGIRIPDFNFIRNVAREFPFPIALTSANRSKEKSTLNIYEFENLWHQLDAVFDSGQLGLTEEQRAASTVIDLSKSGFYKITRAGVAIENTIEIMKKFKFISEEYVNE